MAATFAALFIALYAAHHLGDIWLQTRAQACDKHRRDWAGRLADARHVTVLAGCKLTAVTLAWAVLGLTIHPGWLASALAVDAASHYWADRRFTLARLCDRMPAVFGKSDFYRLGMPRPGRDDNPSMGTGAYELDQAWHVVWLFAAALIASL